MNVKNSSILGGCIILAAFMIVFVPRFFPVSVGQKWEHATLFVETRTNIRDNTIGPIGVAWHQPGNKFSLGAGPNQPPPFSKAYEILGGNGPCDSVDQLLDPIGEKGWELVSHTRTNESRPGDDVIRLTQTWTFKRPTK